MKFFIATAPSKGTLTGFNPSTGDFTYAPRRNKLHSDFFTFYVSDGENLSNVATVSINIEPKKFDSLVYEDLKKHWAWYSAGQLGAMDSIRGEKIRDLYYFAPSRAMSRADFVMCVNAVFDVPLSSTPTSMFADVTSAHLISPLNSALKAGIISGTVRNNKRYFDPNSAITRVEAVVILEKALDFNVQNYKQLPFADKDKVPGWALPAVQNMYGHMIVLGDNETPEKARIRPMNDLTRAEGISLLYKAYLEELEQLNIEAP
jgi:hypothetical protein